jgi:signal transduction histidine kinase
MSQRPTGRKGLRREVAILLPVTLTLLVLLSTFTLFSYRSAISLIVEETRQQALTTALDLTGLFAAERLPQLDELRYLSPQVVHLALLDETGHPVFENGPRTGADPLAGFDPIDLEEPRTVGPTLPEGWITAIAPTLRAGERHYVRVDFEASLLSRQTESLGILTTVVLAVNAGLVILALLFLRHLLTPIDRLIERARQLLPDNRQVEDEVAFLVSSFERAVDELEKRSADGGDELAALEKTLGPNLESGLLLVGTQEEILALNAAGATILGVERPSSPIPLGDLLADQGDALRSVIREAMESGQVIQRRETFFERRGHRMTLGLSVNPLRRDDGSSRAFLVLFADLTETQRQAEEERVADSLAQVGELAAGVAHEMRNSLATFRGYLTLVERSPDDDSITDYLAELRRETDHLQRVLDDFLSFARPESTQLEEIDLGAVVRRAAADPALEGYPIHINATQAQIKGDAQLLERAIRNLLHNATDASVENHAVGPVEVDMNTTEDRVEIAVLDRGSGVPPEIRGSLFQPFVTGKTTGVGLGLALAHRIVHLHAGRLTLEDRPGGGTIALLELPLAIGSPPQPDLLTDRRSERP